jgi:hypothetical protein
MTKHLDQALALIGVIAPRTAPAPRPAGNPSTWPGVWYANGDIPH